MSEGIRVVSDKALKDFAAKVFASCSVKPENAELWAEILVWANLRGVDSHGVLRIPRYVESLKNGNINPRPNISMEKSSAIFLSLRSANAKSRKLLNTAEPLSECV